MFESKSGGRDMGLNCGVELLGVVGVEVVGPHAPVELSPLQNSWPDGNRRRVWFPPAVIVGGGSCEGGGGWNWTCLGTETSRLWAIPSWPDPLEPKA